ncbi:MAG: hypothetical protein ACLFUU_12940 [Desulfobacteraceae bacterium]
MIKNMVPRLAERGKIKIGDKGEVRKSQTGKEFMLPKKLDHFMITTLHRDAAGRLMLDKELMSRFAGEGGKITELPIRLLYDDIELNFQTRYAYYSGNRCICSGDGETAQRLRNGKYVEVPCPCERQEPTYQGKDPCKVNGTLSVLLQGVNRIGGVWKFRTTSYNTVQNILSGLALIKTITGGVLAGIPLNMVLSPKTVTVPTTGQNMVVYVVSIEYQGTEEQLAEIGYDLARTRAEHKIRMEEIEAQARKLLTQQVETPEEQKEVQEEFYPEGVTLESDPEPDPGPLPAEVLELQGGAVTEAPESSEAVLGAQVDLPPEPPAKDQFDLAVWEGRIDPDPEPQPEPPKTAPKTPKGKASLF